MKLLAYEYDLPLKHKFPISRGSIDVQKTLIVELTDGSSSGYGEATTNDYYGVTLESMIRNLQTAKATIENDPLESPEDMWSRLEPILKEDPFALCAVDQAAWDLYGKRQGRTLYDLWGLNPNKAPLTDFTIGIAPIEQMVMKMREMPNWPIYKIKLGTEQDLQIIQRLRQETDAVFRVDANCAWTAEETVKNSAAMKQLGVEFIEQPLPADHWPQMRDAFQGCIGEGIEYLSQLQVGTDLLLELEVEDRLGDAHAELRERLARVVVGVRALHPGLGGNTAHAEAGSTQPGLPFDARDLATQLSSADRGRVPGRAASEDGDIDIHADSVPSVGCVSRCASMVTESSLSPTRSKPWRS
jgi:hypothetical protein